MRSEPRARDASDGQDYIGVYIVGRTVYRLDLALWLRLDISIPLSQVWGYFHVAQEKAGAWSIDKGAASAVG